MPLTRSVLGMLLGILLFAGLKAGRADEAVQTLPKLKSLKPMLTYPDAALRAGLEGKALAAFNLGADGRVTNGAVIYSDDSLFSKYVLEFLSNLRFDMNDAAARSPPPARYRLGFVFCLPPSTLDEHFEVSIAAPIIVKATRLPRSPIRNFPERGTAGPCVKS